MNNNLPPSPSGIEKRIPFFRSMRGKLIMYFLAVALSPMLVLGGVAILQLNVAKSAADDVTDNYFASIKNIDDAELALLHIVKAQKNHIIAPDDATMRAMEAEIALKKEEMAESLVMFETTLDVGEETVAFQEFKSVLVEFLEANGQVITLSQTNDDDEAQALSAGRAEDLLVEALALMETMRGTSETGAQAGKVTANNAAFYGIVWTLIVIAIATLLIIIVAFLVARSITRPIVTVTEVARKLAVGDVNQTIVLNNRDEIGLMAHAFRQMIVYQQQMAQAADRLAEGDLTIRVNPQSKRDVLGIAFSQMITNLQHLIGQTQQGAVQVANASIQVSGAAEQTGLASQQISMTMQQIAEGAAQQTQSITATTLNVEQTARVADGIARGAQEQATGVQQTSILIGEMSNIVDHVGQVAAAVTQGNAKVNQAARHGVAAVEQTSQGMDTIRMRTTVATAKVKEMSNRSKEIGRIVETIDDIADKTDMLALNAAVEAARAGEHGRGFAVVADHVRKLSEDSKIATRDIAALIERVQGAITEAITAMENTVTEVDNGTQLAGDTAQSLQDILQAAQEATALAKQIDSAVTQLKQKSGGVVAAVESVSAVVEENTASAEEMAANSQEVTEAMEGVAIIAEQNNASTEEVSASTEEMSAQVEEVVASADELSILAEQLRQATAQFRLGETG